MIVKEVMTAHNHSWATLATATGKTSSSFIQVANGNPTIGKLKETAAAIGCHWLEFFKDEVTADDLRAAFPELLAQMAIGQSQPEASEQQSQQDQQGEQQGQNQAEKQEPALTPDVAFICPHCHEAIKLGFIK